jgi:hypothetical protein
MGGQEVQRRLRRDRIRRVILGGLILIAAGGAAIWWYAASPGTLSGTPRLVVDRTDVNLGYLRFSSRASATFTLTNAGDGPLVVQDVPRVIVKAGC